MLSLKATLKAIGESITTIKSALDGKATKYTGYGTPISLSLSVKNYTAPSDGLLNMNIRFYCYLYATITNADGTNAWRVRLNHESNATGHNAIAVPVFKGSKISLESGYNLSDAWANFVPFV